MTPGRSCGPPPVSKAETAKRVFPWLTAFAKVALEKPSATCTSRGVAEMHKARPSDVSDTSYVVNENERSNNAEHM